MSECEKGGLESGSGFLRVFSCVGEVCCREKNKTKSDATRREKLAGLVDGILGLGKLHSIAGQKTDQGRNRISGRLELAPSQGFVYCDRLSGSVA